MIEVAIGDPAWTASTPAATALAEAAATAALATTPGAGARSLAVLLADDASVRALNARFRGQDRPTNVLSFPAGGPAGEHLGDIALAFGVCAAEASAQAKPLAHHLQHLVVHGVLHLLGHDHQADDAALAMETLEQRILAGLGVPDPYATEAAARHG
jgi:probable rRNA maturation factor